MAVLEKNPSLGTTALSDSLFRFVSLTSSQRYRLHSSGFLLCELLDFFLWVVTRCQDVDEWGQRVALLVALFDWHNDLFCEVLPQCVSDKLLRVGWEQVRSEQFGEDQSREV